MSLKFHYTCGEAVVRRCRARWVCCDERDGQRKAEVTGCNGIPVLQGAWIQSRFTLSMGCELTHRFSEVDACLPP